MDILKVFLPILLLKLLFPQQPVNALLAAVGGLMAIDWLAVLVRPITGFLLGMVVFQNIMVASLSWIWLPITAAGIGRRTPEQIMTHIFEYLTRFCKARNLTPWGLHSKVGARTCKSGCGDDPCTLGEKCRSARISCSESPTINTPVNESWWPFGKRNTNNRIVDFAHRPWNTFRA